MFRLRPDQEADVTRVLNEPSRAGLIATSVGGGKTATAVEIVRRTGAKVILAIVPPNTYRGWKRHVKMMLGYEARLVASKTKDTQQAALDMKAGVPGFYLMSWEYARQFSLALVPTDFVIGDEVHRAQNRKSNSFAMFAELCKFTAARDGWRLALSATPYGNRPAGGFGVAHCLWPDRKDLKYHAFWPFVEQYMGKQRNDYAGVYEPRLIERSPGAIARSMPLYIRHEPNVACCINHPRGLQADLPKRVIHQVDVELSATQRKIYNTITRENLVWLENCENPLTTQGFPIVLSTRLRQIALAQPESALAQRKNKDTGELEDYVKAVFPLDTKSTKIDALLDILADIPEGERVLVLSHSAGIGDAIAYRINKAKLGPAHAWNGNVSARQRQEIFDAFVWGDTAPIAVPGRPADLEEGNDCRVIVAQVGAIGEGVDGLQWVCANEIWFSMESNNLLNIQAAGRLERDGQTRPVNSWSLEAVDTVEQNQLESLTFQTHVMKSALRSLEAVE